MLAVPTLTSVTVFPDTVATAVFRLVYENAPELSVDGGVNVKVTTPKLTSAIVHVSMVGVMVDTVKFSLFVFAENPKNPSCVAVTVAGVPSVTDNSVTTRWTVGTDTFT